MDSPLPVRTSELRIPGPHKAEPALSLHARRPHKFCPALTRAEQGFWDSTFPPFLPIGQLAPPRLTLKGEWVAPAPRTCPPRSLPGVHHGQVGEDPSLHRALCLTPVTS